MPITPSVCVPSGFSGINGMSRGSVPKGEKWNRYEWGKCPKRGGKHTSFIFLFIQLNVLLNTVEKYGKNLLTGFAWDIWDMSTVIVFTWDTLGTTWDTCYRKK